MGASKKKFGEFGSYERLKRQFCRRYGIDPRSEISRRDVIEDAAFTELETRGELPPDRNEAVLSAIFFVLSLIAAKEGIKPEVIEQYSGNVYATRPRVYVAPSREELEERENASVRRLFAPCLARIKHSIAVQNKGVTNV